MRDIYLITKNELLVTVRTPFWIFYGLFQPIIYLLLFGPLLSGVSAMRGLPGGDAIQFFAPGLLVMNALYSAGFEGFTLLEKVECGFLERLRVTPVSRVALALGLLLQSAITLLFQSGVLVACALFFGIRVDPLGAAALACLLVLIGITMASTSYCLALITREGGALAGITNTLILPLRILSGVMLPVGFGPPIIQTMARLDPFYYAVSAARALIGGVFTAPVIPLAFGMFVGLSIVTLTLFIRTMREAVA